MRSFPKFFESLPKIVYLMRMHKPTGSILLSIPLILGLSLAHHLFQSLSIILILLTILARSLGCIINDWWDRDIDYLVQRTQSRPLTSGQISLRTVAFLVLGLCVLSAALILSFFPKEILLYSLSCLVLMIVYASAKRWFPWPQVILGISFSWSILLIPYLYPGSLSFLEGFVLFSSMVFWIISFDTAYAQSDYKDDCQLQIHSIPKTLGPVKANTLCIILNYLAHCGICFLFPSLIGIIGLFFILHLHRLHQDLLKNPSLLGQKIFHLHTLLGLSWIAQSLSYHFFI